MKNLSEIKAFADKNGIFYKTEESFKTFTSFRIGGKARIILYPDSASQTSLCVRFLGKNNYAVLGNCSNILAPDGEFELPIIKSNRMADVSVDGDKVVADAGALLSVVASAVARSSLTGMERLFGIPGSIGGAVVMNAGAYGGEMSQIVVKTEYVNCDGDICCVEGSNHDFGYRRSCFKPGDIVCRVEMKLEKGNPEEIKALTDELTARRRSSQPLDYPSAGSVFKRPEGFFAGKLIEDCGLKGFSIGGAQVSVKHAGFIINNTDASSEDVKALIKHIQSVVREKTGVSLETEIRLL